MARTPTSSGRNGNLRLLLNSNRGEATVTELQNTELHNFIFATRIVKNGG